MSVSQAEVENGAKSILGYFKSDQPFFIGRNGSTELELLRYFIESKKLPPALFTKLERYSGVWPATEESVRSWAEEYVSALGELDGLAAGWYQPLKAIEEDMLDRFAPKAFRTPLRSLEPYYVDDSIQWTQLLANKTVAVISSFSDTIYKQLHTVDFNKNVWPAFPKPLLPYSTRWNSIRSHFPPIISPADDPTSWASIGIHSWSAAVDHLVQAVIDTKSQIAIIGCGGLGLLIGARLKRKNISVILLGGATQVLFGIRGARWAKHGIISKFWNPAWVSPSADETPRNALAIEGGCYWLRNST